MKARNRYIALSIVSFAVLYEPGQGDGINHLIQVALNSTTETVSVYMDRQTYSHTVLSTIKPLGKKREAYSIYIKH